MSSISEVLASSLHEKKEENSILKTENASLKSQIAILETQLMSVKAENAKLVAQSKRKRGGVSSSTTEEVEKKKKTRGPGSMSAYNFFVQETKQVGGDWSKLSADEKAPYQAKAAAAKAEKAAALAAAGESDSD